MLAPVLRRSHQHALDVRFRDQDLARLRALIAGDDATPLEHVDQPPRARVADPQPALKHRDGGGLGLGDDRHGLPQEIILVG